MGKREDLLESAIRLFVDQGFDNTPTAQISKNAKVATGTFFNYFNTKEDLINNAFLYSSEKSMEHIKPEPAKDFKEYLKNFWDTGMRWSLEHHYYVKFMLKFSNSVYVTKLTLDSAEKILSPYFDFIGGVIESDQVKKMPQELLTNTYNNIFSVFFEYLNKLDSVDETIIELGFSVLWGALTR